MSLNLVPNKLFSYGLKCFDLNCEWRWRWWWWWWWPGVPGRFLFFLGGALGLGLGFVFCWSWVKPPMEVDKEKGSAGIICILEKKKLIIVIKWKLKYILLCHIIISININKHVTLFIMFNIYAKNDKNEIVFKYK